MENNYETVCLCALNSIFGYEPRVASALIENLGSASAVFAMSDADKDAVFGPYSKYRGKIVKKELDAAEAVLQRLRRDGTAFVGITSDEYPKRLKGCEDAPLGIFVRSDSPVERIFAGTEHYVAVVGTREITPYGEQWCRDIVRTLADSGAAPCIVSGLAYGTDIIAHRTAVECGLPTIAVMATGTDTVYPSRHRGFAEHLAGLPGCALVTDYPPGTAPVALNFIRRNRIIAGLSDSVILVESAVKGGGMITSRLAFSYNRSVYALPGRGDDSRSQGCNHLIREGVAEIIDSLEGLNVMRLTGDEFNILNWLAVLLAHRKFDITSSVGNSAREYIIDHFMPDTTAVDVMIGYRADDSYFSFAEDFVNNTISLRDLNMAMHLGMLGEQVVLLSRRSFDRVKFISYEVADYREYYYKRAERDQDARTAYASHKKDLQQLMDDIFVLDIMREGMGNDDARLQSALFE